MAFLPSLGFLGFEIHIFYCNTPCLVWLPIQHRRKPISREPDFSVQKQGFLDGFLGYKEFEETIETLLGHFLLYVVSGGKRLDGLQIAGEFPPDRWIFVRRRCASCTPQNEERSRDLFVFVGRVHLEIDSRARAIIAASA